jgi:uncharacterized OB-fold protein
MASNDTTANSAGLKVCKCDVCSTLYFPARLICHRCGSGVWSDARVFEGTIEESTRIPGADGSQDKWLATVDADGLRIIAALPAPLPDGARVVLDERNGAPWATLAAV